MQMVRKVEYKLQNGLIGVVADTHIPARAWSLPPKLFSLLKGVDLILHAGDLEQEYVLEELKALAPVEAVAGNMDPHQLVGKLGKEKLIDLGEICIGLVHGWGGRQDLHERVFELFRGEEVQAVVFGHTHYPFQEYRRGVLLFNPGSVGDPRWGSSASCGRLQVKDGKLEGENLVL